MSGTEDTDSAGANTDTDTNPDGQSAPGAENNAPPNNANGADDADGADGTSAAFNWAKALMQTFINRCAEGTLDEPSLMAQARATAQQCKVGVTDLRNWTRLELGKRDIKPPPETKKQPPPEQTKPSSDPSVLEAERKARLDKAKAALQQYLDQFADAQITEPDVMVHASDIAREHKIGVPDLRAWAKLEITKLRAKPTKPVEPPPTPAELEAERAAAWALCKDLAISSDLLNQLLKVARRLGLAGDRGGVLCTFLLAVSRLLKAPARMLRKGAAASGKSFVIDRLLVLFNPDDYIVLTAASAKALIYSPRDFRHRFLVVAEAAALVPGKNGSGNDEFAMLLRELLSSGRLIYHTVQPTGKNGKLAGVSIEKEGPVAFSLTTARENIEEELATRILVTLADETDKQTQIIISATADAAAGLGPTALTETELEQWRALQDWLRLGPRDVVIPFAPAVGRLIDRRMLRIRRDFSGVLSLTQASALLHRAQRQVDEEGRIVAEIWDYAAAIGGLGEGLEEQQHGDTTAVDAVREAVASELRKARRKWWRAQVVIEFCKVLQRHCAQTGSKRAAERLLEAKQSERGRARVNSVTGCINCATAEGQDTSTGLTADPNRFDPLRWRLFLEAGVNASKIVTRPTTIKLSSQALANALGIGRHAARIRLDNAIEAGAVIEVEDYGRIRSRTAPKELIPGTAARPAIAKRHRRGAFPDPDTVQQAWLEGDLSKTTAKRPSDD